MTPPEKRSPALQLPLPEGRPVAVWRDASYGIRIGVAGSEGHSLFDVLGAAADRECPAWARAWALLHSVDPGQAVDRDLLLAALRLTTPRQAYRLQHLLVRLALAAPRAVARMFIDQTSVEAMPACGAEAVAVAVNELRSCSPDRRRDSGFALELLAQSGSDVPRQAVVDAIAVEDDDDAKNALGTALREIDERLARAATRAAIDRFSGILSPLRPKRSKLRPPKQPKPPARQRSQAVG